MRHHWLAAAAFIALAVPASAIARPIAIDDLDQLRNVSDPDVDPSGTWVAYSVGSVDRKADKNIRHIYMSRWDGTRTIQLTNRPGESESSPKFSPDGRYLAFTSSRADEDDEDQLWLLDRTGGEAKLAAKIKGSVVDYAWSPSGRQVALIVTDPDPDATDDNDKGKDDKKKPKPIVIDRFQFKSDDSGYLGKQRQRLVLLDLGSGQTRRLTTGDYDEYFPAWSPDGTRIAFVSNRDPDPDRTYNYDLFVVGTGGDTAPTRLTSFPGMDNDPDAGSYPAWSPDGKSIAYLEGGPVELFAYGVHKLAVIPANGGERRVLTPTLDRNVGSPTWSADGKSIQLIVEDDGTRWIGQVPAAGGALRPVIGGRRTFTALSGAAGKHQAVLLTDFKTPPEVYALEGGKVRPLSRQNEAWLSTVTVSPVEETKLRSKDGTEVHGYLVRPAAGASGPVPTILRIHGGPQSQFESSFSFEWQLLAANGYAVVAANPRGSTGRGEAYAKGIYAAWGSVDVPDVLAAVDDAVARGIADPNRLGVGGWSYGGMLTNYTIASDPRFKAATSGAGISNILAGYGTDQYIRDYEMELGKPWEKPEAWMKVSYPFFHADRIVTPTLFMAGDKDFNVPLLNSEQMYQALRSQGVDTQLVIYPGEKHGIRRPSFLRDRFKRYLDWYAGHLK